MVFNKLGIIESSSVNDKKFLNHFCINSGVSLCLKKEYRRAIDSIEKYIPYYERFRSKRNLSFAYYYCGKAYLGIDSLQKAVYYFKKTDTIFQEKNSLYPHLRENYQFLINYYQERNDLKNNLLYLNRLIKLDSITHSQEVYLSKGIIENYEIPQLKAEKNLILQEMNKKEKRSTFIMLISLFLLIIITSFLFYQVKLKKTYKKKFNEIINESKKAEKVNKNEKNNLNISEETIKNILSLLNSFEEKKKFIDNQVTLGSLAKEFNTNTNYLSKIINRSKGKTFSNYINELRINYVIEKLKVDSVFRKYTIKAIAEESGFKNSESFSQAFLS